MQNTQLCSLQLKWARRYLQMGWSVIPLRTQGKEPALDWKEFTKRRATDAELSEWFASGKLNLGIVAGAISGLVVVDADGPVGMSSARALGLTSTTIALTGKGKQFFYRAGMSSIKNAVRLLPGIDLRSDGGYVVAAPSIHPNGKRYVWECGPTTKLPPFPANLIGNAVAEKKLPTNNQGWIADALANLKEGQRNDTFTRIVGRLHHDGLDDRSIRLLLSPHAQAASFSLDELDSIIRSVNRYTVDNNTDTSEDVSAFLSDELHVDWICPRLIAKRSIGFVAGLPETMKTWLTLDLAIEAARGGPWLGRYQCGQARVLFIDQERFKGETQRRFKKLLWAKNLKKDALKDHLFIKCGTSIKLDIERSFEAFRKELHTLRPDLVIIDSFATMHTTDENNRMAAQFILEKVKTLRNEIGCTFVFIDHENKSVFTDKELNEEPSAFRMVGSVGKVAAAEFVLTVRRLNRESSVIHHSKSTLAPAVDSFYVTVKDIEQGTVVQGLDK